MNKMPKIMPIFGTRPEAIKMAPIVHALQAHADELETCVVVTAQHRSMLDQVLNIFEIEPDYDLNVMTHGQTLSQITARALTGLEEVIRLEKPDMVLVQGDTTTAFVGGLAAFYNQTAVGHVEAGLRTRNKYNPFPEEINRHFLGVLADLDFAPTQTANEALLLEGIPAARIIITGNSGIDALLMVASRPHSFILPELNEIDFQAYENTILVTAHRRENLGAPMEAICMALRELLLDREDLQLVFPVHLNPKVQQTVHSILGDLDRARLISPLEYPDFVHLMKQVDLILTDSGGVQEEAPALGKPVLVMRATTERPEAVVAGTARLVGTDRQNLVTAVSQLLDDPFEYGRMQNAVNPYGDGYAAPRIVDTIRQYFGLIDELPQPFVTAPAAIEIAAPI